MNRSQSEALKKMKKIEQMYDRKREKGTITEEDYKREARLKAALFEEACGR